VADTKKIGMMERSVRLDRAAFNKDARTVTVRFSTETPVKRWFGTEILSHKSGAVKLDRFNNGAAVLMEHDTDKRAASRNATITATGEGNRRVRAQR
jgi:hypothetical protein